MGNVPVQFKSRKQRKPLKHAKRKDVLENKFEGFDNKAIDTQHMLISALLPPAVKAFMEECEREVSRPQTYEDFQDPRLFDQAVFTEGIKRVSQRDYEKGVTKIANSFGLKKSQVSKLWVKATAKKIEDLQSRDLRPMDIRAVFIDGKRFRKHGVIIAPWCCGRWPQVRAWHLSSRYRKRRVVHRTFDKS